MWRASRWGKSLFQCAEGHEWRAVVHSVARGSGCGVCGTSGFRSELPSWLYLVRHDGELALKIGITNNPRNRIDRGHAARGWRSVRLWRVDGAVAQAIERAIIRGWREAGLPVSLPTHTDGYTETVSLMSVEVDDVILEVERLIRESASTAQRQASDD